MARYSLMADGLRRSTAATPQRDALLTMKESFTFAQLEPRVAGLARRLLGEQKVESSSEMPLLAVRVDRSMESMLAVLACAYAEIPFVAIDSATPTQRMLGMLQSLGSPNWMLDAAAESTAFSLTEFSALSDYDRTLGVVRLSGEATRGDVVAEPFTLSSAHPSTLAMVILTSGTTGIPKGVMYDWAWLENCMHMRHQLVGGDYSATRSGTFAPISFAVGALYLLDLAVGHTVIALDPTSCTTAELLARLVAVRPTKLIMVSQFARFLSQFPNDENFQLPSVEAFIVGGESCRYEYVKPLVTFFPNNPLVLHGLSSSESVQHVENFFRLEESPSEGVIPVGFANARSRARFEPVEGNAHHFELTVSGNVALGYYDDPETTNLCFSIDDEGHRRWRTGDVVSVAEGGLLSHEGRIDDLVKISGFLVSTVDVERAVQGIVGVSGATVVVGEASGRIWLEAHVELDSGSLLTATKARRQLEAVLPAHMIPRTFVRHEQLPVNLRGKVDREAMRSSAGIPW